jgi:hypothetical protein
VLLVKERPPGWLSKGFPSSPHDDDEWQPDDADGDAYPKITSSRPQQGRQLRLPLDLVLELQQPARTRSIEQSYQDRPRLLIGECVSS